MVKADGAVGRVDRLTTLEAPRDFLNFFDTQVEAGIRSCAFEAGRDTEGKPQDIWLILALRFK
jgi:hypothetical protein